MGGSSGAGRWSTLWAIGFSVGAVAAPVEFTEIQFRRVVAAGAVSRSERFVRWGLVPIARVAAKRRDVRRFQFIVWPYSGIPVVEVERLRDGTVVMRVFALEQPFREQIAPVGLWEKLTALDASAFAPPPFERERLNQPRTFSSCHGNQIAIEGVRDGKVLSAGGDQCVNAPEPIRPALKAAMAVYAEALLQGEPGCQALRGADPVFALETCFRSRSTS